MRGWTAVAMCTALWSGSAAASEEEPLWELGMGAAVMTLPDYRGSDEGKTYVFPIPYFVYNGEHLRVDRHGARGDIVQGERVWLDFSTNLGPPADSEHNTARRGMPDLDPTIEAGPSLKILWWQDERRERLLTVYLPLRAVVATDFSHWHPIGWVFSPHLTYDRFNVGPGGGWNFSASFGPVYANEKFHDYYYEVAPEYATEARPVHDADGGYSGTRTTLTLSKRFKRFWIGAFARYDTLSGAVFENSPLVRDKSSFMAGVGMSWIFAQSKERVPIRRVAAD